MDGGCDVPVRKIPKSASASTGRAFSIVAGRSLGHESGLERDAYLASNFVPGLVAIEEQPLRIQSDANSYHPDTFLRVEVHGEGEACIRESLVEIKYLSDLKEQWTELWPRLELGRDYAFLDQVLKIHAALAVQGDQFFNLGFTHGAITSTNLARPFAVSMLRSPATIDYSV